MRTFKRITIWIIVAIFCVAYFVTRLEIRHYNFRAKGLAATNSGAFILVRHRPYGIDSEFTEWHEHYPRMRGLAYYVVARKEDLLNRSVLDFLETCGAFHVEIRNGGYDDGEINQVLSLTRVTIIDFVNSDIPRAIQEQLKAKDERVRFHVTRN